MQFYDGASISTSTKSLTLAEANITEQSTDRATRKEYRFGIPMPTTKLTSTNVVGPGNGNPNPKDSTRAINGSADLRPISAASLVNNSEAVSSVESTVDIDNGDECIVKKTTLGIPMHPVPEVEIAELTKIIENANRYLQIAFAEDLYLYCQANNINFAELRDSLNTKWNVNILEPREGIGGHCLPKDTKMFLNSSKTMTSKIIEAALQADGEYRRYRENRASRVPHID
jgi:hypothetical protein